jgi:Dna[CI] antecedent, DciA
MRAKYLNTNPQREPQEISDVLGAVIEGATVGIDVRHAEIVARWGAFAPGDWSSATPIGVRDQVLLVEVSDGSVASLLRYQTTQLLSAISEDCGEGLVRSVRIRISRK